MSKNPKKKQLLAKKTNPTSIDPALKVREMAEQPQHRLADLQAAVMLHCDASAWDKILEISRLPLVSIHEKDRPAAEVWLLRARTLGLYPPDTRSIYDLPLEAREELTHNFDLLFEKVVAFYTLPEFDLYLATRGGSIEDSVHTFHKLARACLEISNVDWLRQLRSHAFRLLHFRDEADSEVPEDQIVILDALPDITLVLNDAYSVAEASGTLDEEAGALVNVLKHELDIVMADARDYRRVGDALHHIPSPSEQDVAVAFSGSSQRNELCLTPRAWAFMWELENTSTAGFSDLLERYSEPFAADGCEGLRLLLSAIAGPPTAIDAKMSSAVSILMRFIDDNMQFCFGEQLTLQLSQGPKQIYVGQTPLHMASVSELLLCLYELAPKNFPRSVELESFYRIFEASTNFTPLEDEDQGDQDMPGLAWLCEQSISFQFAAACSIQGIAGRMCLLLDALRRTIEAGLPPPYSHFTGNLNSEALDEPETGPILEAIAKLVPLRGRMDETSKRMWFSIIGNIFDALSGVSDIVRAKTIKLAREFSDDLLENGHSFRLAYLEQVAGNTYDALLYYLVNIDTAKDLPESSVKNSKLLWARSDDISQVQRFVDTLGDEAKVSRRADVVCQLLADAKASLAALNKQDQFERTAVSRWPSLTAPARKLLSVFASIREYNGLAELANYASMDVVWVKRHYDKLVDLGMLLVTDQKYRINPHIAPLLERESQHAVIGCIVRTQGTSAVKQVFNSQREFSIYQILVQVCPNHLVFPNCSLQSIMSFDRIKEFVNDDDFSYYLRASVDIVVVSSTTYLPMLAIEVDSVWHDTERQQKNDGKKDRLFAASGIPFMRLRPVGSPSENAIRSQVAEHVNELVRSLRADLPGYEQTQKLLEDLSCIQGSKN